jgi:hypothetical protein
VDETEAQLSALTPLSSIFVVSSSSLSSSLLELLAKKLRVRRMVVEGAMLDRLRLDLVLRVFVTT